MKRISDDLDDPRRRWLLRALAAGWFGAGAAASVDALAQIFGGAPSKLPPGRSIYRIAGQTTVNDQPATLQTPVKPGDTVATGKDGEMIFVVGENAHILRNDSRLTIQASQDAAFTAGLRLFAGKLLSVFGKGRPVQISTTTATVGIRGTGVYAEADPELTYFCTCYGIADISSNVDPSSTATVTATHHDRPLYIPAKGSSGNLIRNAPFINHTDQELMLIETLVGRTPPFVFPMDEYNAPRRDY